MIATDQLLFVHVPRTGGRSVREAMGEGKDHGIPWHWPLFFMPPWLREGRVAFGVVRDPLDRLFSLWRWRCRNQFRPDQKVDVLRNRALGFERWVMQGKDYLPEDYELDYLPKPLQRRPAAWWLDGCDEVMTINMVGEFLGVPDIPHVHEGFTARGFVSKEVEDFVQMWHAADYELLEELT